MTRRRTLAVPIGYNDRVKTGRTSHGEGSVAKVSWREQLRQLVGTENVWVDAPLKSYTTFRIGGPADALVAPATLEQLAAVLRFTGAQGVPLTVIGNGSNLIVRDKGIRGVVVQIADHLNTVSIDGQIVTAQAGVRLTALARAAYEHGLGGLEFASGIPGTLGGAVVMNAGAYGGEMKDIIRSVTIMDFAGQTKTLDHEQMRFGYRTSAVQGQPVLVIEASMQLAVKDPAEIKAIMDDLNERRRTKQPLQWPSAGSVFRRPPGNYAGPLIEGAGLKGASIGGAQVSELHAGFIINTGGATAQNVIDLIRMVQQRVKEKYGVDLETEVRVIGEE